MMDKAELLFSASGVGGSDEILNVYDYHTSHRMLAFDAWDSEYGVQEEACPLIVRDDVEKLRDALTAWLGRPENQKP